VNSYERKQAERKSRLEARAASLASSSDAAFRAANRMAEAIPMGQPILVGHHSEHRDRRYRAKIHRKMDMGCALADAAKRVAARAAAVGTGGISSDDPAAVRKLREQLAQLERRQEHMKTVNRLFRLGDAAGLAAIGLDLERLRAKVATQYSWERAPFVPFELSNLGANIRRIKARIVQLEAKPPEDLPAETIDCGAYKVRKNFELNRVQILFPGKPAERVRDALKALGFRWSPSEGAWQRMLNASIVHHLTAIDGYARKQLEGAI
jgi:hypothetical protein